MESTEQTVARHEKDLYHGDGRKAGLTIRMQQAEDHNSQMEINIEENNKRVKSLENRFITILILLLTILGGVVTANIHH